MSTMAALPAQIASIAPLGPPITSVSAPSTSTSTTNSITPFSNSPRSILPPEYDTIPRSARPSGGSSASAQAQAQAAKNREKQALRDAWAKQDLPHDRHISFQQLPSTGGTSAPSADLSSNTRRGSEEQAQTRSRSDLSTPSVGPGSPGYRGSLPAGMNIQEALAKCEDPTLGWSMTFWVTIADPVTQHVFFACPASGQCSWDPPIGAFVVPRSSEGEWWELADASRNNRSYYYNTLTGKTQWTRPSDAFVIPLGLIQRNALPARPHQRHANSSPSHLTPSSANNDSTAHLPTTPVTPRSGPRPPPSPRVTPNRSGSSKSETQRHSPPSRAFADGIPSGLPFDSPTSDKPSRNQPAPRTEEPRQQVLPRTPLSIVEEVTDGNETDLSDNSGPGGGWWEKRKSKMNSLMSSPKKGRSRAVPDTVTEEEPSSPSEQMQVTPPSTSGEIQRGPGLPKQIAESPIFVDSVRTKRMSTGLHPLLPTAISSEIQAFQADDFASKYFATKRSGMLRSRVPLERIMEWQKQPITQPLLVLSKSLAKDAITTFRVIQHAMGERDRPVENAKITSTVQRAEKPNRSRHSLEKITVLEEVRWMIQVGVTAGEMRDEIFSQLIKQLTKNPDHDATVLGFQLFCVLVNAFAPSKNFEVFVRNFLRKEIIGTDGISVMCRYCMTKLEIMIERGGRGRALTIGEIEHASDAAFYPTVYGEKLERIMELQDQSYPGSQIPIVLTFLTNGILALGGLQSEGIFRVPGDGDSVAELKSRIDRGHYRLEEIDDPHVAASLFKQWLRELSIPLIPEELYNAALIASKSTTESLAFVMRLPKIHRRVLLHVISFVQLFLKEEVVEVTKMTPQNLSLVLAPNILRTTSEHLVTVYTNAAFESKFILQLLEHLEPGEVDPEFVPVHAVSG